VVRFSHQNVHARGRGGADSSRECALFRRRRRRRSIISSALHYTGPLIAPPSSRRAAAQCIYYICRTTRTPSAAACTHYTHVLIMCSVQRTYPGQIFLLMVSTRSKCKCPAFLYIPQWRIGGGIEG